MSPASSPPPSELDPANPATGDSGSDDYMAMTFADPAPAGPETSLQRRQRERREAEARGRVKSKAQQAAEEAAARERRQATSLLQDNGSAGKSKGLAMMARMGFTGGPLGRAGGGSSGAAARTEPLRAEVKEDRAGVGMEGERKRRAREAAEAAGERAKRARAEEGEYRERVRREREAARAERLVAAAQKVAERMAGDEAGEAGEAAAAGRPLKAVDVLWRGLVRGREEADRDGRMRRDLEESLSRLPTYEDEDEDEDDRRALGKDKGAVYVAAEDLDEEDPELDEFNALAPEERLQRLVAHLRSRHNYCFWCKFTYPDADMEGCPGLREEDHD